MTVLSGSGVTEQPTAALWVAVAKLTEATRVEVARAAMEEYPSVLAAMDHQPAGFCHVPTYRAAHMASTSRWADIPSLWDQSVMALTGGEVGGGTGSKPLRERSLADLDLMEIMGIIRDTTRHELERFGTKTRRNKVGEPVPFQAYKEFRALASLVVQKEPADLWWWTYRMQSWGRLLETYLNAAEHKAKPVRLRNTPCPLCRCEYVRELADNGDIRVNRPIVVDYRDGYVRAARCEACSATWFRGAELAELARLVGAPGGEMMSA